jgi:tRNA(Ile)-lysidine synthase
MDIIVQPGLYVVAVSGGVDSMVLLDLLKRKPELKLVVAHFDHGIRDDSHEDRYLVRAIADENGLPFVYHLGYLGIGASEDEARKARYDFLRSVKESSGAQAIITAHHHDDLLETAIINMLRGTGRKGLTSLKSRPGLVRPMLHVSKEDVIKYAKENKLQWREDITNADTRYLRNHVRHNILQKFDKSQLGNLRVILDKMTSINNELDDQIINYLHIQPAGNVLDRKTFVRLPHTVAKEIMASWLRKNDISNFDQKTLERLVVRAKTLEPGKLTDIVKGYSLQINKETLMLVAYNR